ncbi:YnfA family protein [Microbulbifer sp. SSSA002]|uniref:YnfA family protein n=1 Tax=Microbulbifer sp. SSSA002 TaxID=3243376 RepID=UPI0040393230
MLPFEIKTIALFLLTALAEIVGCYMAYLWLKQDKSIWLLLPGAISLAIFAGLLTLHPAPAGRVYAAYGGIYIFSSIIWLWLVNGVKPTVWDLSGAGVAMLGMAIIMFAPEQRIA